MLLISVFRISSLPPFFASIRTSGRGRVSPPLADWMASNEKPSVLPPPRNHCERSGDSEWRWSGTQRKKESTLETRAKRKWILMMFDSIPVEENPHRIHRNLAPELSPPSSDAKRWCALDGRSVVKTARWGSGSGSGLPTGVVPIRYRVPSSCRFWDSVPLECVCGVNRFPVGFQCRGLKNPTSKRKPNANATCTSPNPPSSCVTEIGNERWQLAMLLLPSFPYVSFPIESFRNHSQYSAVHGSHSRYSHFASYTLLGAPLASVLVAHVHQRNGWERIVQSEQREQNIFLWTFTDISSKTLCECFVTN